MGCWGCPQVLFRSPLPLSRFALSFLGIPNGLLGSPLGFISITSASLSVRFEFPWVALWAARVALRFYFDQVLFRSPLPPFWFALSSLRFAYGLLGSPAGFISITSAYLGLLNWVSNHFLSQFVFPQVFPRIGFP